MTGFSLYENLEMIDQAASYTADSGEERDIKVLLIDDDRTTRRVVRRCLSGYCTFSEAASAGEGIEYYNRFRPDLVFMDIQLPDGDGQTLLDWVLCNDPDAFVVMFSGQTDNHSVTQALRAGARGFLMKPFDPSKMLRYIRLCPSLSH